MKKSIYLTLILNLIVGFSFAQNGYKVGDTVADFSLKGTDDKMHRMSDYKDANGYIIIFTCNHCPYSVAYEDRIVSLNNKYAALGYYVIAINPNDPIGYPDDNFDNMKKRAKAKNFTFPYLVDKDQKTYPVFGATKTPHVFLLDKKKVVQYIGAIDNATDAKEVTENYLENAIKALMENKMPNPSTTKAIGCGIKAAK